jgi:hypothetical protein
MHAGAQQPPIKPLSGRVPWHDTGWTGHVSHHPRTNSKGPAVKRIGRDRDDALEASLEADHAREWKEDAATRLAQI